MRDSDLAVISLLVGAGVTVALLICLNAVKFWDGLTVCLVSFSAGLAVAFGYFFVSKKLETGHIRLPPELAQLHREIEVKEREDEF